MRGLKSKTFIVAGGATGIGAATAIRLAEEGANVVVGDINLPGAKSTVDTITSANGAAVSTQFDLADNESIVAMVQLALAEFGEIHGLHNVGADLSPQNMGRDTNLLDTPLDVWERTLDVNVIGYVRTSRAVLPHLLAHGGGSIVNVSSGASISASDGKRPAYGASKSAVNAMTRHIAKNWGPQGVRCNGLMPGLVMGETQRQQNDTGLQEMFLRMVPTTRLGEPSDLAAAAAFLLSDDAAWINGQVWAIDGGANMRA